MSDQERAQSKEAGISGLPKSWAVAVQLIGTFGLAVFLVLYYVLIMQPKEAERYEQLRESVNELSEIVAGQQSLLSREQVSRLEELFLLAMKYEVSSLIVHELRSEPSAESLSKKIEDKLIYQTHSLEGLKQKGGGTVSEMLTHRIRNSGISEEIAQKALTDWRNSDFKTIVRECKDALTFSIGRAAMAK